MDGNLTMGFSGRWIGSRSLNSVDGQSTWLYLSLSHFPAFAKNREGTTDMCSGVCSADLLSVKNKLTDVARKAQIFSDPIFPSANSESQNHRTSGGLWSSLLLRAGLGLAQVAQGFIEPYLQGWRFTVFLGPSFNIWPPLQDFSFP